MMSSTNKVSVPQSTPYMSSFFCENNQSFNKQLNKTEIDNKLNTIFNDHTKHDINNSTPYDIQSKYSQQALKDNCKKFGIEGNIRQKALEFNFNPRNIGGQYNHHSFRSNPKHECITPITDSDNKKHKQN